MSDTKIPKVSMGLPVFNGEQFILKRIENLLAQTFTDFELIISDNCSTDSTYEICKKFVAKDSRIRCIRQKKNIGGINNFNAVLKEAKGKYFLWVAVDDLILPEFLEKNVNILDSKKNVVCSSSKMKMFGDFTDWLKIKQNDSIFTKIEKKIKKNFSNLDTFPASGNYESRVTKFLQNCNHNQIFYGLYRKNILDKCFINDLFIAFDTAYALSVLKYGEHFVINKILMYVFDGGESRSGMISVIKSYSNNLFEVIFPYMRLTTYCKNQIGTKIFLKNINFFIKLNGIGLISLSVDIIRQFKKSS